MMCAVLATLGVAVAYLGVVDWRHRRIPNTVVLPSILFAIVAACVWQPLALAGGAVWWLLFSFFHQRSVKNRREGSGAPGQYFGGGDAKFAAVCGTLAAWHGPGWVLLAIGTAGVLTTGRILIQDPDGKAPPQRAVAMGPAMVLGTLLAFAVSL
ncbi:MAG: prepilin peptidase [Corynebacterium urealyticum]|uniref:Prepilin peptidase n=2 Tax=Corynebacterium TaxID=1716 RepID=A0A2W5B849_9CORY|nr:MAG: prepilin peptidase [Corynebacterium urealyticum]